MIDGRIRIGIAGLLLVVFALAASVMWMANKTSPASPDSHAFRNPDRRPWRHSLGS